MSLLYNLLAFFQALACFPRISEEAAEPSGKRPLDKKDPDPYVVGNKHKMGRTHTSRPGNSSASTVNNGSDSDDDLLVLEVFYSLSRLINFSL
jgi:hypothetical protein